MQISKRLLFGLCVTGGLLFPPVGYTGESIEESLAVIEHLGEQNDGFAAKIERERVELCEEKVFCELMIVSMQDNIDKVHWSLMRAALVRRGSMWRALVAKARLEARKARSTYRILATPEQSEARVSK